MATVLTIKCCFSLRYYFLAHHETKNLANLPNQITWLHDSIYRLTDFLLNFAQWLKINSIFQCFSSWALYLHPTRVWWSRMRLIGNPLGSSLRLVDWCHVMSCHVMSCHVMSCHHVIMSCHVMSCHVMSCDKIGLDR